MASPAPSPYLGRGREWAEPDSSGKLQLKQSCGVFEQTFLLNPVDYAWSQADLWTLGKEYHTHEECWWGAYLPRPWARRWINHFCLWRMASAMPDLRLPSQSQDIAAPRLIPNYTAWNIGWIGFDTFHQQVDAVLVSVISTTKINDVYACVALTVVEHCLSELASKSRDIIWYRLMDVETQWLGR